MKSNDGSKFIGYVILVLNLLFCFVLFGMWNESKNSYASYEIDEDSNWNDLTELVPYDFIIEVSNGYDLELSGVRFMNFNDTIEHFKLQGFKEREIDTSTVPKVVDDSNGLTSCISYGYNEFLSKLISNDNLEWVVLNNKDINTDIYVLHEKDTNMVGIKIMVNASYSINNDSGSRILKIKAQDTVYRYTISYCNIIDNTYKNNYDMLNPNYYKDNNEKGKLVIDHRDISSRGDGYYDLELKSSNDQRTYMYWQSGY